MNFQQMVLIVAGILLIITLVIIGLLMHYGNKSKQYPPVIGVCPDYWEESEGANGMSTCTNVQNLGTCGASISYNPSYADEKTVNCARANWAKSCDLTWDGITNVPNICSS
jgi:hypothetical protein